MMSRSQGASGARDVAEELAFALVPDFLGGGARLEPYDHRGRQAVPDALLHYPDGRIGAPEGARPPAIRLDSARRAKLAARTAEQHTTVSRVLRDLIDAF